MKIIQSLWTKPALNNIEYENSRMHGGWINHKYFIMSTCLSCLTAKRYYSQVELYTDQYGHNLFIDQLNLPYSYVDQNLDQLDSEDSRLWVLGKLKTIEIQCEPFIHMDNDVYIWEKLSDSNSPDFLMAQNLLPVPLPYQRSLKEINDNFKYIPNCLLNKNSNYSTLANIGVFGGNNLEFFRDYCDTAFDLLFKNRNQLELINVGRFNQILDEYLFICLVREKGLKVKYQINDKYELDPIQAVLRFNLVPFIDKYIHLIGIAKQNTLACEQLELRLKYEFPLYHQKVVEYLRNNNWETTDSLSSANISNENTYKLFDIIYNKSLEEILDIPIKLKQEFNLITKKGEGKSSKIFLQKNDSHDDVLFSRELAGINEIMLHFTSPISMNDLIEGLDKGSKDFEYLKFKLIDIVSESIITENILEFV
ncbi:DUF6734 family protein [Pedobacter sp. MR2016-24]|uniref:DUF6734 family protein n=1 Tax=Pedobacter sp. MR2016-24 TaxID=2994466 RepID=UPI00224722FC|nr:DUF6734 family protein [Pedobacter sp. MR2016-24]MCX2485017.1 hypothetical protein [Pedobacter sp. MR2016-24]